MSERSCNRSYDWWSDTSQEWRNEEREESILDPKWNLPLSNTDKLSEVEEVTETVQRTRKKFRGSRKNRDSSDSETRNQSRVKWQLSQDQQKEADSRLLSLWQLIGGVEHSTKHQPRTRGSNGGERTSANKHPAGSNR